MADPVAIDFGPDGRLWVAEMTDYGQAVDGVFVQAGKVRYLEDTDQDGQYDRATIFVDGLRFPTDVKVWREGVLICDAPDILYCEDTDADGHADVRDVLFSGFATHNGQARVNSLRWGMDGWVYGSCGLFGGEIVNSRGETLNLGGRDFRMRPKRARSSPSPGRRNKVGHAMSWENGLAATMERCSVTTQPATTICAETLSCLRLLRPSSCPVARTRIVCFHAANWCSSSCPAPRAARRPLAVWGSIATMRSVLSTKGTPLCASRSINWCIANESPATASRLSANAHRKSNRASSSVQPTGGFVPFRSAPVRTAACGSWTCIATSSNTRFGSRRKPSVSSTSSPAKAWGAFIALSPGSRPPPFAHLAKHRGSGQSSSQVATACYAIWRNKRFKRDRMESHWTRFGLLARHAASPAVQVQAIYTLNGLHQLDPELCLQLLEQAHPEVRRHVIRLVEQFARDDPRIEAAIVDATTAPQPFVRQQAAYSLGEIVPQTPATSQALLRLLRESDEYLCAAALSSVNRENIVWLAEQVYRQAAAESAGDPAIVAPQLAKMLVQLAPAEAVRQQIDWLAQHVDMACCSQRQFDLFFELLLAMQEHGKPLSEIRAQRSAVVDQRLTQARQMACDAGIADTQRRWAIDLLACDPDHPQHVSICADLIDPRYAPSLQSHAIQTLSRIGSDAARQVMLDKWHATGPVQRREIIEQFLSNIGWSEQLLDAIQAQQLPHSAIDAQQRQQLALSPSPATRALAEQLFSSSLPGPRAEMVARFQPAASMAGDRASGQRLFVTKCSACHQVGSTGFAVGPDLAALSDQTRAALLTSIVDPSRDVDARYMTYVVQTVNGQSLSGMLTDETSSSLTLKQESGKANVILRAEIESAVATQKSLMPDGLEQDWTVAQMADLLEYLMTLRTATP